MTSQKSDAIALVLFSILLLAMLLGGAVSPALAASSEAQKPMVWRMAHYQPEQRVLMQAIKWWSDELEKRTSGRIKIRHFFGEELARAKEILPMVAAGGVELGTPTLTYHPSEFPLMQMINDYPYAELGELFYLAPGAVDQVPALQAEWKKNNVMPLSHGGLAPYGIVSTKPVKKLDDLKGLRIRVFGPNVPLRMARIGMVPLTLPSSEIYEAMAKGSVECSFSTLDQHRIGLFEVAKTHLKGDFCPSIYAAQPVMNLKLFNSFAPDLRKIIMDLQVDHLKTVKRMVEEGDVADEKFLKSKGVNFYSLSEAENKKIQQISSETWDLIGSKLKDQDGFKSMKAALVRLKAEYDKTKKNR
jgi:TRAP-type transport system periplasmic protein